MSCGRAEMELALGLKTTRITIETDTFMVIRRAKAALAWCPNCDAVVDVIILDANSVTGEAAAQQLRQWLDTGRLHFWQPANVTAQICLTSLLQSFQPGNAAGFRGPLESMLDRLRRK